MLFMSFCGVKGVWTDRGEEFFFSVKVVNEFTAAGVYTLYLFWELNVGRWMNAQELEAGGIE